jgi:hypothetical protein
MRSNLINSKTRRAINNVARTLMNYTLPGRAMSFVNMMRGIPRYMTGRRSKFGRRRINKGLEINKADGGWKSTRYNGRSISQTINWKLLLIANRYQDFAYYVGNDNEDMTKDLDIAAQLNDKDEFLTLRKQALQYRVENVCLTINYSRIPKAGERWNKLMITPETDLIEVSDPLLNKNSMYLDMSHNGTKNYNIRINRGNTESDNAGWIIGQAQFSGILKYHFDQLDMNIGDQDADTFAKSVLGTVQIAVRIRYVHKDINDVDAKSQRTHFSKGEIMNFIKNKMIEENKNKEDEKENEKENTNIDIFDINNID